MSITLDGTGAVHLRAGSGDEGKFLQQTVMAWYKIDSALASQIIGQINDQASPADLYGWFSDADGVTVRGYVVDNDALTDSGIVQVMTVDKWYFFAMVRDGDSFLFYAGDETTTPTLKQSFTETGLSGTAGNWAVVPFGGVVHGKTERWKHYTAALNLTRITEEWGSLTPFSTTDLKSYNPLVNDYLADAGSASYTIEERGTGTFGTSADSPDPDSGDGSSVVVTAAIAHFSRRRS